MRCFYVLIHGKLKWKKSTETQQITPQAKPVGFYCHRYVLSSDRDLAIQKAIRSVSANLDNQTGWLSGQAAELIAEAEKVEVAPLIKGFLPGNRGHTFYEK